MKSKYPFVQTAILHLNYSQMKKICDEITEEQILGRSLLKGFSIAAAQARAEYGVINNSLFFLISLYKYR